MMATLIKNADWVLTFDNENTRIKNGSILFEGNRIVEVGKDIMPPDGTHVIDAKGKIVMPGMVNTHHHFYQTLTRNIPETQDIALFPWLLKLYEIWKHLTPEAVRIGAMVGLGELLKTGCTTSTDHHYVFPYNQPGELIDEQIRAADDLGIRFHPSRGSMSLGKDQGGLPPNEVIQTEEVILKDSERLVNRYHDPSEYSMCKIVFAPCSPFSVTGELMKDSAILARKHGVFLHTHLAETKDEDDFCKEKFGLRPVEYMEKLGWLGEDVWFAHGVHLNDGEVQLLGDTRTGVAHCPASNMKLNSGVCRVKDLQKAGARVGLAVDGSASNDSSNMWAEARIAYLLQKLTLGTNGLTAEDVLRMATVGGAQLLGRNDIGSIEKDKAADMILIDFQQLAFAGGQHDPVSAIVNTGNSNLVDMTIVNGKIVVENGRLINIDEEKLAYDANKISLELLEKGI
ncbi:MAG: hydroxydechloroatrazine ethylaminohydrolase [Desulfitibacter sp. BRH_c19]|nr:MAG: hydroxydechloroatrazine ethylaminohydrolase [Desulfitibacter sp. BRH_c19]